MTRVTFLLLLAILCLATFLRFYNLAGYTEFRGDQGRAGLIAIASARTGSIPLAGPTTLRGQHLGPFFYYLSILFFRLGNFHPLAPAIAIAFMGVASVFILFLIMQRIVHRNTALAITLLWAVSPAFIVQDRTFWEPHMVPFFSLLFLYGIIQVLKEHRYHYWMLIGISTGILLQLHYFNIFFIPFAMGALLYVPDSRSIRWAMMGSICFFFVLSPFLVFEMQHGWKDISGIVTIIFDNSTKTNIGYRTIISNAFDYGGRIIGYILPFGGNAMTRERTGIVLFLTLGLFISSLLQKKRPFLTILAGASILWFITGTFAMGIYREVVYNHYLAFIIPSVIIFVAYIGETLRIRLSAFLFFTLTLSVAYIQLVTLNQIPQATYDIERTASLTNMAISLTRNQPFAFTLYPSLSFSDLHYRFFFASRQHTPRVITDTSVNRLVILCDTPSLCPNEYPPTIPILCYEEHCSGSYGEIDLSSWTMRETDQTPFGTISLFERS